MNDTILFIFEGVTIEGQIFSSIETNFFPPLEGKTVIRSSFRGEIFQLWSIVKDDPYLDIVEVLKERPDSEDIRDLSREEVSEIHLFFDHDAHSRPLDRISQLDYNEKINCLLDTFNNASEQGKLWISYPMAEALKHCKKEPNSCFYDAQIKISENNNYKNLIDNESDYLDIRKYDVFTWNYLTAVNIQRVFCLVNDAHKAISEYNIIRKWFGEEINIVKMIQEKQYTKFISPKDEVVALSPFPLFLLYYFGEPFFNACRCEEVVKTCSFFCYQ